MKVQLLALTLLLLDSPVSSARVRGSRELAAPTSDTAECRTVPENDELGCDALSRRRKNKKLPGCKHIEDGHCVPDPEPAPGELDGYCSAVYTSVTKGSNIFEGYVEVDACSSGMGYTCSVAGKDNNVPIGTELEGRCELEYCNGKAQPGLKDLDEDQTNEATWRKTICHRTCSATNPWVRITIDNDAWGSNGTDAASGCGHQAQHIVTDECKQTIEQIAMKDAITFEDALFKVWGPNDRDYLIKDHGTRQMVRTYNGWVQPECKYNSGQQKTTCNKYSQQEKDYWFIWERACPYVRNGACCGDPLGWKGPCCGGAPYPGASITLKKYACRSGTTCSDVAIATAGQCSDNNLTIVTGSDATYCYKVTNGVFSPLCALVLSDPKINMDFKESWGGDCLEQGESFWASLDRALPGQEFEDAIVEGLPSKCNGPVGKDTCVPLDGARPVRDEDPAGLLLEPAIPPPTPKIEIHKYSCTVDVAACSDVAVTEGKCVEDLLGPAGNPAKYCYKAENVGETDLCNLVVTDSNGHAVVMPPHECVPPNSNLWSHPSDAIHPDPSNPETTDARVCSDFETSGDTCSDPDVSTLRGYVPDITIKKYSCKRDQGTCDGTVPVNCEDNILPTEVGGSDAMYCYLITNTGTSNLCQIRMRDELAGFTAYVGPSADASSLAVSASAWTEEPFLTTFPNSGLVETYGNVSGYPCSDNFQNLLDSVPVTASDPSGLSSPELPPPPYVPEVKIIKVACPEAVSCSVGSSMDTLLTNGCVDGTLAGPPNSPAKYCYFVENRGNETLCQVKVEDKTTVPPTPIDVTADMPDGCVAVGVTIPLSYEYPETFPQTGAKDQTDGCVNAIGAMSGIEKSDCDPAGLESQSTCPEDMGLTGSRANEEASCSNAVFLHNSIPSDVVGIGQGVNLADIFFKIETRSSGDGERLAFHVKNPFSTKQDMYIRYHKPMGLGDAMEKACVMEPQVGDCPSPGQEIVAECINPFEIDGNDKIKPYTVVDLYFVSTLETDHESESGAEVDECCLGPDDVQPALTQDVKQLTFVLDCFCPSLYSGTVARGLRGN